MAKKQIKFKSADKKAIPDADANVYGQRILKVMKENDTHLVKPWMIVEDAKDKDAPYHDYFEWDNKKAGNLYRDQQARRLIGTIVQVVKEEKDEGQIVIRAFHNVRDKDEQGYGTTETVFSNEETAKQVIMFALREAKSWAKRYEAYKELAPIRSAIEAVTKNINPAEDTEIPA